MPTMTAERCEPDHKSADSTAPITPIAPRKKAPADQPKAIACMRCAATRFASSAFDRTTSPAVGTSGPPHTPQRQRNTALGSVAASAWQCGQGLKMCPILRLHGTMRRVSLAQNTPVLLARLP